MSRRTLVFTIEIRDTPAPWHSRKAEDEDTYLSSRGRTFTERIDPADITLAAGIPAEWAKAVAMPSDHDIREARKVLAIAQAGGPIEDWEPTERPNNAAAMRDLMVFKQLR